MPLQKLQLKPGVDRENTRYTQPKAVGTRPTKCGSDGACLRRSVGGCACQTRSFTWHLPLYAQLGYSSRAKPRHCRH
jgi:hypothetical protein